jgi:hypothetical protein
VHGCPRRRREQDGLSTNGQIIARFGRSNGKGRVVAHGLETSPPLATALLTGHLLSVRYGGLLYKKLCHPKFFTSSRPPAVTTPH